eukprot:TRINITY_DN6919_c0_g1_i1.p1 TRINITY_DN6919_c0_g1~~TRINITY_DN6919_c0_g1_i1.p1  ORF type:complete len:148 (-),score=5.60 TRINITY_DN6919_c0_g1_i1:140-583(-)
MQACIFPSALQMTDRHRPWQHFFFLFALFETISHNSGSWVTFKEGVIECAHIERAKFLNQFPVSSENPHPHVRADIRVCLCVCVPCLPWPHRVIHVQLPRALDVELKRGAHHTGFNGSGQAAWNGGPPPARVHRGMRPQKQGSTPSG